jgi:hypothetical protein
MANQNIITPTEFNGNNIGITGLKKNKNGKWNAYLTYTINGRPAPFYLETPQCRIPFGVSAYQPNKNEEKFEYSLTMSCNNTNPEEEEMLNQWFTYLEMIDNKMIDYGVQNAKILFGKEKSREVVEELYSSIVKKILYVIYQNTHL